MTLTEILNNTGNVAMNIQSDIMQEAVARLVKERRDNAVEACTELIDLAVSTVEVERVRLREIRRTEKAQAAKLEKIGLAAKYLGETGNPLPFYVATGRERDGKHFLQRVGAEVTQPTSPEWQIPEGWVPDDSE